MQTSPCRSLRRAGVALASTLLAAIMAGLALGSAALGLGLLLSDASIKYDIDELEE